MIMVRTITNDVRDHLSLVRGEEKETGQMLIIKE